MLSRSAWLSILLVFVVAVGARVGWIVVRYSDNPDVVSFPDEHAYLLAGKSLAFGDGLLDEFGYRATYMPGYPTFISVFERLGLSMMSLRLTQAILGALVAPATFVLARRWVLLVWPNLEQRRAMAIIPLLAGLAAASDPFLVFFSGLLLTEVLYAVLLVSTWWVALGLLDDSRPVSLGRCVVTGLLLIGCVMMKPSAIILPIIVSSGVILYHRFTARAWLAGEIVVAVFVLGLLPWAVRNASILGEVRWTTTRGGITFYDSVQANSVGGSDLAHTKTEPEVSGLSEIAWDRYWHDRAMAEIKSNPWRMVVLAGKKFLRTWNVVPNEPGHRRGAPAVISALWMVALLVAAAMGWWTVRRKVRWWMALLTPVAAFTIMHMIFIGSVRYRIPLMPMVSVLAAVGIGRMLIRGNDGGRENSDGPQIAGDNVQQELSQ